MKKIVLLVIFISISYTVVSQPVLSDNGHPEHVIAGAVIGGGVSYLVYRKTGNKLKSFLIGAATATALGYAKEALDPSLGRVRSDKDFGYSALGGVLGAGVVFPLRKRQPKKTPNIAVSFENPLPHTEVSLLTANW